jgi:hypothetical protein
MPHRQSVHGRERLPVKGRDVRRQLPDGLLLLVRRNGATAAGAAADKPASDHADSNSDYWRTYKHAGYNVLGLDDDGVRNDGTALVCVSLALVSAF